jgi:hypothetical protein
MSRRAPQYWPLLVALLAWACVFEYTVRSRDWFLYYHWVDNFMHIGWGAVIALAIIVLWRNNVKLVLVAVVIWQVLWEIGEMVMDRINDDPPHMRDYPFPDGAIDTCMDLLGAIAILWITRKSRRTKLEPQMNAVKRE